MKKNTHPFLIETKVQYKDGSIYKKRWLFFRSSLPLEVDANSQSLWKKDSIKFLSPINSTKIVKK